jgi:uncharacterized protein
MDSQARLRIAVIGTGISGLSAAWLLGGRHDVTLYEGADRVGGHSNTVRVIVGGRTLNVDTGFIVFNSETYPNFTALLKFLGVPTQPSDMSLAVSLNGGEIEYSGSGASGLFAQPRNLLRPRFWSMLYDLSRFYRKATRDAAHRDEAIISLDEYLDRGHYDLARFYREAARRVASPDSESMTLGEYLDRGRYGQAFRCDHLLPMASAIWSASPEEILCYPAGSFIRFQHNHGLLRLRGRPLWETVVGGSRTYVDRLVASLAGSIKLECAVKAVRRMRDHVIITGLQDRSQTFDHVVIASHADQALAMLTDPSPRERTWLGSFRYSRNLAVLHTDATLMPKRRAVWSSWNYLGSRDGSGTRVCVSYWMNRLQKLETDTPVFVTLNPPRPPRAGTLLHSEIYEHPIFDAKATDAQRRLWLLQGERNTWYCGAYFGAGFHEDGLQAGLAVAEQLGGVPRPWRVPNESSRIVLTDKLAHPMSEQV